MATISIRFKHLPGQHDQMTHGNRGTQSKRADTEDEKALRAYLQQISNMSKDTVEHMVLTHGKMYNPQPLPKGYKKGKIKEYFSNAFALADKNPELTYVEGFAMPDFMPLPIHHAWVVDKDGNVIDNTWKTPGSVYMGIPFTTDFMYEVASKTEVYGILGYTSRDIFRQGIPKDAIRTKGGEGSGHYGHAGRPGLVGGSQPDDVKIMPDAMRERIYGKLTYSKIPPNYNETVNLHQTHTYILDQNGNWIYMPNKNKRHTQLYALYVAEHREDFDLRTLESAEEILDHGVEEASTFEDVVMEKASLVSVELFTYNFGESKEEPVYKRDLIVKVSSGSPISVLSKAVKRVQRLIEDGHINISDYDQFIIVRGTHHQIKPEDFENISGFTGVGHNDFGEDIHYKEDLAPVEKHDTAIIAFNFSGMFDFLLDKFKPEDVVRDSHITLLNLGDLDRIPITKDNLMFLLEEFSKRHAIIDGKVTGVATFSSDPDKDGRVPLVLLYDSPQLPFFRVDLQRMLKALGMDYLEQDHGFIPHITLAYIDEPYVEVAFKPETVYLDSLWLYWGDEKHKFPLLGEVVEKQLPIDDESRANLISIRRNIFNNDVDQLAEKLFTGDISLGAWEETMRRYIRELHTSTAAIGKGGWGEMSWRDWGRLGTQMREQYRYLHGFAEHIAANRETISIAAIKARAHLYGTAAGHSAYLMEAGAEIATQLPWMPKDGSTECLVGCKCQWNLQVIGEERNMKVVQAVWQLNPAEHCGDCVDRNGFVAVIRVNKDVPVPSKIGGY